LGPIRAFANPWKACTNTELSVHKHIYQSTP